MKTPSFIASYQTEEYDFCDRVVERLETLISDRENPEWQGHYMEGSISNIGEEHRKDHSFNFASFRDPLVTEMHNILSKWIEVYAYEHTAFRMQACASKDMKVQKTPPKGGFHTWHCEQGSNEENPYRNLTWTLYLNDIPEGEGETEFIEYGVKVQPKKGLLTFFPAAWTHTHRGNPVYSCDKYIATGWYYLV